MLLLLLLLLLLVMVLDLIDVALLVGLAGQRVVARPVPVSQLLQLSQCRRLVHVQQHRLIKRLKRLLLLLLLGIPTLHYPMILLLLLLWPHPHM